MQDTSRLSRRDFLNAAATTGVSAFAYDVLSTNDAYAEITDAAVSDLSIAANKYANEGTGVAILVLVGKDAHDAGYSTDKIGLAFENQIKKHGIQSEAFTADSGTSFTSITFITKSKSFGPYNVNDALKNAEIVTGQYERERKFANPENSPLTPEVN